jgi:hypothetical protein
MMIKDYTTVFEGCYYVTKFRFSLVFVSSEKENEQCKKTKSTEIFKQS